MSILKRLVEAQKTFELLEVKESMDEEILAHVLKSRDLTLVFNGAPMKTLLTKFCEAGKKDFRESKEYGRENEHTGDHERPDYDDFTYKTKRLSFIPPHLYCALQLKVEMYYGDPPKEESHGEALVYLEASKNGNELAVKVVKQIPPSSKETDILPIVIPL